MIDYATPTIHVGTSKKIGNTNYIATVQSINNKTCTVSFKFDERVTTSELTLHEMEQLFCRQESF